MVSRSIANDVNFAERVAVSAVVFAVLIAFLYGTLGSQGSRIRGGLRSTLAWSTYSILGCLTKVPGSS